MAAKKKTGGKTMSKKDAMPGDSCIPNGLSPDERWFRQGVCRLILRRYGVHRVADAPDVALYELWSFARWRSCPEEVRRRRELTEAWETGG